MTTLAALISALAAALCFHARADALGAALAMVALIFAIDTAHECRKAAAEVREQAAP